MPAIKLSRRHDTAKGDCVNGMLLASGNFQPAAGVEVLLIFLSATGVGDSWSFIGAGQRGALLGASSNSPNNLRVPINNTYYLDYIKAANNGGYGGIQTK